MKASSRGEGSPVVASKGYEAKNRRVEIEVSEGRHFKLPRMPPLPLLTPPTAAPLPPPKPIDLTYHPEHHTPTPGEDLQERLRLADKAVREAQKEEQANHGISAADVAGRILRRAAKKLGLPKWAQDRAQSLGKKLPSMGARAVMDQLAGETRYGRGRPQRSGGPGRRADADQGQLMGSALRCSNGCFFGGANRCMSKSHRKAEAASPKSQRHTEERLHRNRPTN